MQNIKNMISAIESIEAIQSDIIAINTGKPASVLDKHCKSVFVDLVAAKRDLEKLIASLAINTARKRF
jgi:hypothetical protein